LGCKLVGVDVANPAEDTDKDDEQEERASTTPGVFAILYLRREKVDAGFAPEFDDAGTIGSSTHARPPSARPSATVHADLEPSGLPRANRTPPNPSSTLTDSLVSSPSVSANPGICETPPMRTIRSRAPGGRELT